MKVKLSKDNFGSLTFTPGDATTDRRTDTSSSSGAKNRRDDFWAFRRMITPMIIQAIFWIGVIACIIGGIVFIAVEGNQDEGSMIAIGIALILVGPVVVRLWCEFSILFFRINETLTDIKNEISKRSDEQ